MGHSAVESNVISLLKISINIKYFVITAQEKSLKICDTDNDENFKLIVYWLQQRNMKGHPEAFSKLEDDRFLVKNDEK